MQRTEMVCDNCIKFDGIKCRLNPDPVQIAGPQMHWCSQGQWRQWSERYQEMEPYYWGEWEDQL